METAYLICAIVGGTLIACQFLLTLLGLGGHHDAGGDHDLGGHEAGGHDTGQDADHDQQSHASATNWFLGVLTFRTLTAAVAFFGLTGLVLGAADAGEAVSLGGAVLAALAALYAVSWAMRAVSQLNTDGTVHIRKAVGAAGSVYLSIPANKGGAGKVHVAVAGRLVEYKAVTPDCNLPTGAKIVVVAVANADTVEVVPENSCERVRHE